MRQESFSYDVLMDLGVLSGDEPYSKMVKVIRYGKRNHSRGRVDIRTWFRDPDESERMCKGITLSLSETRKLYDILGKLLAMDGIENMIELGQEEAKEAV